LSLVEFLTSPEAAAALSSLRESGVDDPVKVVSSLRRTFDRDRAAALAELHAGRHLALAKFGASAPSLLYTRESLEQATPLPVARHRAARVAGVDLVADLGCGIGGDAIAFRAPVVGVDLDPAKLAMARHNVAVEGGELRPVRADVAQFIPFPVDVAFADPARRDSSGRRIFDPEAFSPPLSVIVNRWRPVATTLCVKVHPGYDRSTLPDGTEAEFVSLNRDMRECSLWFGAHAGRHPTRATILPAGATLAGTPEAVSIPVGDMGPWLYEPDPAILRAGLVGDLAVALDLVGIDPRIAYLTGPGPLDNPFVTGFAVEDVVPFNRKRISTYLRTRDVGRVIVKKRGSPVDPAAFERSLQLHGGEERILVLTRVGGAPTAVVCFAQSDRA